MLNHCSIVGCGDTAKLYTGEGYSIGVNDCWRFGVITDRLIVVNSLRNYPDRLKTVMNSTPRDGLYSMIFSLNYHPNYKHIGTMQRWKGRQFKTGTLYCSSTSPFIGVSMAHNMGFKEIVLYGVDMVDHPNVKGNSLRKEVQQYDSFCQALVKEGTKVYLSSDFGALKDYLPVWNG